MPNVVICENCGNTQKLPEGRTFGFCGQCGSRLEAANEQNAPQESTPPENTPPESTPPESTPPESTPMGSTPLENTPSESTPPESTLPENTEEKPVIPPELDVFTQLQEHKKTRGSIKIFACAAAALVVIIAVFAGFIALGGSGYKRAETKFFARVLRSSRVSSDPSGKLDFTLQYQPSEYVLKNAEMTDITIGGTVNYKDETALADLSLTAGGRSITDMLLSIDGKSVDLSLPQLTEYCLRWALSTDSGQELNVRDLDERALRKTILGIGKAYFSCIEDTSTVERGENLSVGGFDLKCDRYTIEFTQSVLSELGLSIIEELEKNKNLTGLISDYIVSTGGYPGDFPEMLDEVRQTLSEMSGDDRIIRMTVWVKGRQIVARKIEEGISGSFSLSYRYIQNGRKTYIETELAFGEGFALLTGDFEERGGTTSGTLGLTIDTGYYGGTADYGVLNLSYTHGKSGNFSLPVQNSQNTVIFDDFSPENAARAEKMADDLLELYYSGDYEYNVFIDELLYTLWDIVDDIVYYSDHSYSFS